ncbi:WD40 repeat-like protein [Tilletiaria anomala UBC 951]|uniref:Ribosome biogenesis protein YTM1 n=1 Tax=Tilletiaria anomala (strain ATCC 24038 / CBS 436.72 / UBC 951) TaxID=1037660 RepID=A0A066W8W2_TILAU|nr:WD40 repeat-like protein [Tilletiaria anomala UBC 951]KDN47519.1 WD40 repeat-like protein [Tilletiaria anomala UBC 951]
MADTSAQDARLSGRGASTTSGDVFRNVPIVLKTSIPGASIPLTPYLVPTSWRRTHLSTLVNRVLRTSTLLPGQEAEWQDGATAVPFDFIVDGQLLRNISLGEYLERSSKDAEITLELEYIRSTLPPRFENQIPQDDWVGSVDASRSGLFLTSSYDGTVRIFSHTSTSTPLYSLKAAPAGTSNPALSSAAWLPPPAVGADASSFASRLVTAGMDGIVRLFELPTEVLQLRDPTAGAGAASRKARMLWSGALHAPGSTASSSSLSGGLAVQPLSSVTASADGRYILSAGWDGCVGVWDVAAGLSAKPGSVMDVDVDEFDTEAQRAPDVEREADEHDDEGNSDEDDATRRKRRKAMSGKRTRALHSAAMGGSHRPELILRHTTPLHAAATATAAAGGSSAPALVPGSSAKVARAIFDSSAASSSSSVGSGAASRKVFSAGWNGSVKYWDIDAGGLLLSTKSSDKVIMDVTQLTSASASSSAGLLATAHIDRSIGLWDFRSSSTASSSIVLPIANAHTGPVNAVAAHPISGHLLASASLDGSVKGWDVRSSKQPLFTLTSPPPPLSALGGANAAKAINAPTRLLCVDWMQDGQGIVAGGQDCRISVWRGQGIGSQELKPLTEYDRP